MAITKEYTTEELLAAFLGITIPTGEADDAINQAVDIIDSKTDRNFIADAVATARLFNGSGKQDLLIDECIEVTKVEVGTNQYGDSFTEVSAGGSAGYYLHPANYSQEGIPIRAIHLRSMYWTCGYSNEKITAKWGYSEEVPPAITLAANILAGGIYQYHKAGGAGNIKSEKIGNYSVTYENESGWDELGKAIQIIEQFRKISI